MQQVIHSTVQIEENEAKWRDLLRKKEEKLDEHEAKPFSAGDQETQRGIVVKQNTPDPPAHESNNKK